MSKKTVNEFDEYFRSEEYWKHRKENFRCEVKKILYSSIDEILVSVTSNGNQWSGLILVADELKLLVLEIQKYLKENA